MTNEESRLENLDRFLWARIASGVIAVLGIAALTFIAYSVLIFLTNPIFANWVTGSICFALIEETSRRSFVYIPPTDPPEKMMPYVWGKPLNILLGAGY